MYILGHAGIAAGLGYATQRLLVHQGAQANSASGSAGASYSVGNASGLAAADPWVPDLRLIIIGALVPDLTDKVVGPYAVGTTRMLGHTLLFNVALIAAGVFLLRTRENRGFLTLSLASLFHIVQDRIWETKGIALWPIYGLSFPSPGVKTLAERIYELTHSPEIFVPEIVGVLIVAAMALRVWKARSWNLAWKRGVVG